MSQPSAVRSEGEEPGHPDTHRDPVEVLRGTDDLSQLLDEVRELLGADTAVVLLLDESRTVLEAVAWSGLELARRAGARIPVGRGFAGRVAHTREPLVLDEVTDENVLNPLLRRAGIRSLLGVPLLYGSTMLGVLHVGSFSPRTFTAAETRLLQRVAQQLAPLIHLRVQGEEHTAALVLQRSLLPTTPTPIRGLDIAGRYIPADGDLGGDWYDVFRLPDDRVGIVMGDVVGHGLTAAVVMGRLRSALRSYALDYADPAEVLGRLDRKISHFEPGALATVLYGVAEAPYSEWKFSSAGHLPPLLVEPGAKPQQLQVPHDLLLGVNASTERRSTSVHLAAGASLCLFTDGLVERRQIIESGAPDIVERGTADIIATLPPGDAETACTVVVSNTIGTEVADDDVALLVVRRVAA